MGCIEKETSYLFVARIVFFITGYLLYFALGRFLLTPGQFGIFGIVLGLISLTNVVLVHGIQQSVSKFVSGQKQLAETIKFKAFKLEIFLSTAVFLAYFFAAPALAAAFNEPSMVLFIQVSATSVFFHPFLSIIRGYLNGLKRFKHEALLAILSRTMRLILPIAFVVLGFSLFGAFLGIALGTVLSLAAGIALMGLPRKVPGQEFESKALVLFAVPVIGFSFIQSMMMQVDLFFVKALISQAENAGYYVAAATLARLPYEVIMTITLVLFPLVSETTFAKRVAKASFYVMQALRYTILFILPAALVAYATAPGLIRLFYGNRYASGAVSLSILSIGYLFLALFVISTTVLIASGKQKQVLGIGLLALSLDIALNYFLVPRLGMQGAAIATALSFAAAALLALALLFAKFRVFPFKALVKALFCSLPVVLLAMWWQASGLLLLLEYAVIAGLYIGMLFLLREVKESDIAVLKNALK